MRRSIKNNKIILILLSAILICGGFANLVSATEEVRYEKLSTQPEDGDVLAIVFKSEKNSRILYHASGKNETDQVSRHYLNIDGNLKLDYGYNDNTQLWLLSGDEENGYSLESQDGGGFLSLEKATNPTQNIPVVKEKTLINIVKKGDTFNICNSDGSLCLSHDDGVTRFYVSANASPMEFYKKSSADYTNPRVRGGEISGDYMIVFEDDNIPGKNRSMIHEHHDDGAKSDQITLKETGDEASHGIKPSLMTHLWRITKNDDGSYYITSIDDGCRIAINGPRDDNQRVLVTPASNDEAQKLQISQNEDGAIQIYREINGVKYYISHPDGAKSNGAAYQFNTSTASTSLVLYDHTETKKDIDEKGKEQNDEPKEIDFVVDNDIESPNTVDNVFIYVVIFAVSTLGLVVTLKKR